MAGPGWISGDGEHIDPGTTFAPSQPPQNNVAQKSFVQQMATVATSEPDEITPAIQELA